MLIRDRKTKNKTLKNKNNYKIIKNNFILKVHKNKLILKNKIIFLILPLTCLNQLVTLIKMTFNLKIIGLSNKK